MALRTRQSARRLSALRITHSGKGFSTSTLNGRFPRRTGNHVQTARHKCRGNKLCLASALQRFVGTDRSSLSAAGERGDGATTAPSPRAYRFVETTDPEKVVLALGSAVAALLRPESADMVATLGEVTGIIHSFAGRDCTIIILHSDAKTRARASVNLSLHHEKHKKSFILTDLGRFPNTGDSALRGIREHLRESEVGDQLLLEKPIITDEILERNALLALSEKTRKNDGSLLGADSDRGVHGKRQWDGTVRALLSLHPRSFGHAW